MSTGRAVGPNTENENAPAFTGSSRSARRLADIEDMSGLSAAT